ncbi:MAG: hypothetical protein HGA51_01575 [Demequinaceae bacterium]|nr:hypothetical protein [Demequinaceae bacterium]
MIPWRLISRSAVADSHVDLGALRYATQQMQSSHTRMEEPARDLVAAWRTVPESYATSHTTEAVGKVALVERSTNLTRQAVLGTITALSGLVYDLEAANERRAEILSGVDDLRAAASQKGPFWLMDPQLALANTELWWRRDALVREYSRALQRCDTALDGVRPDPFQDDPNNQVTQLKDGTVVTQGRFDDVPLFLDGDDAIRGDQVRQGGLGDCWLLATMGSLADQNPQAIRDMINDNGDGTYTVKLWVDGKRRSFVVDGDFLVDASGRPVYAGGWRTPNALWPLVLEKAVAQACGGYEEISGDSPSRAIELFLGDDGKSDAYGHGFLSSSGWDDHFDDDVSPEKLAEYCDDGYVVVASSTAGGDESTYTVGDATLHHGHAYEVADVQIDENGDATVTVVNPWNSDPDPFDDDGEKGVQVLTWDEFTDGFRKITYAPTG